MAFFTGSGSICQFGKESTFGTAVSPSTLINMTSESIAETVTKSDEGSLLLSKTATSRDLMSVSVSGSVSFILRPEFAGMMFSTVMGKDVASASGTKTKHTITLCGANDTLPSSTMVISRGAATKKYAGVTFTSVSLDASAGDYVKGSLNVVGVREESGTVNESNRSFTVPSYRCTEASCTIGDTSVDLTSCSIEINNNVENAPQTYSSGKYSGQPQHGIRSVSVTMETLYTADVDTFKSTYMMTETNANVVLTFRSSVTDYTFKVTMPNVAINSVSANVGGTGAITASIGGEALSVGSAEPITIEVIDDTATSYTGA